MVWLFFFPFVSVSSCFSESLQNKPKPWAKLFPWPVLYSKALPYYRVSQQHFFYISVIAENRAFRLQLVCTANPGKKEDFLTRKETAQNEGGCFPHTVRFQAPKPRALTRPPQRSVNHWCCPDLPRPLPPARRAHCHQQATPTAISKPAERPEGNRNQENPPRPYPSLLSCCVPLVSPSCKGTC